MPKTTRRTPVRIIAPEHIGHGSPLAYIVAAAICCGVQCFDAARIALISACDVISRSVAIAFSPRASTVPSGATSTAPKGMLPRLRASSESAIASRSGPRSGSELVFARSLMVA